MRIFHQVDPAGLVPGGIDTFVRGLIKAAPPDIQISVVGLTTDQKQRPVGRWATLDLGGRRIGFFPVARKLLLLGTVVKTATIVCEDRLPMIPVGGTPRTLLDTSRLKAGGWSPGIDLAEGVERTYRGYANQDAHATR